MWLETASKLMCLQGADPQMVAFMQAGGPDALQMWQLWPVLLGLTLRAEPRTVDACTSVVNEGLVNISVCASSFASAVFQVTFPAVTAAPFSNFTPSIMD